MKTFNTLLLLFLVNAAVAQKKKNFFDHIYFSSMAGEEIYQIDQSEWKNMYVNRQTIPYLLDTMQYDFFPKDGFFLTNINSAVAAMAGKSLFKNNTGNFLRKREIEWRTGIHFKSINHSSYREGFVSSQNYPSDTTKINTRTFVGLNQQKKVIEWQNTFHFKTRYLLNNRLRFIIGTGLGINRTISNHINESYSSTTYTWNSAAHRFDEKYSPRTKNTFKAKPELHASYIFYLGTEFKISKSISFLTDGYYSIAHFKYSVTSKKTEGYWLGLTFCYSLN